VSRVAIAGHRGLSPIVATQVESALREAIGRRTPGGELVGLSCIADGADSIFAQAVLEAVRSLIVVVPAAEYRGGLPSERHHVYDALLGKASEVIRLDRRVSDPESHMAASRYMLDNADELIAVWDGLPARSYGGTADVVQVAVQKGIPVTVIWPKGASRD
jgi:hypothetical protein